LAQMKGGHWSLEIEYNRQRNRAAFCERTVLKHLEKTIVKTQDPRQLYQQSCSHS